MTESIRLCNFELIVDYQYGGAHLLTTVSTNPSSSCSHYDTFRRVLWGPGESDKAINDQLCDQKVG